MEFSNISRYLSMFECVSWLNSWSFSANRHGSWVQVCEPHAFKKIQYKGIRVFIVMHCLRNMYSEAARSGLCIA